VNSRKQFNTPFGFYANPRIVDELNHFSCSKAQIAAAGFEYVLDVAKEGVFVYFDPPYVPLSATAYFTAYTGVVFDFGMQRRLRDVCDELDDNGVIWMMSNSYADIVLGLLPGTVPYQHSRSVTGHQLQGAQAGEGCGGHRHGLRGDLIIVDLIYISA